MTAPLPRITSHAEFSRYYGHPPRCVGTIAHHHTVRNHQSPILDLNVLSRFFAVGFCHRITLLIMEWYDSTRLYGSSSLITAEECSTKKKTTPKVTTSCSRRNQSYNNENQFRCKNDTTEASCRLSRPRQFPRLRLSLPRRHLLRLLVCEQVEMGVSPYQRPALRVRLFLTAQRPRRLLALLHRLPILVSSLPRHRPIRHYPLPRLYLHRLRRR